MAVTPSQDAGAIDLILDYTLDEQNAGWFNTSSTEGTARRQALNSAAGFLSQIITNDDWNSLTTFNETFSVSDIAAGHY